MKHGKLLILLILLSFTYLPFFHFYTSWPNRFVTSPVQAHQYRIDLILPTYGDPFWDEVAESVKISAQKYPILLRTDQSSELIRQMEVSIASNVDGILVVGNDTVRFNQSVERATQKGIPVFTIGSDAPSSLRKKYIGSDQMEAGKKMGRHLQQTFGQDHQIGIVTPNHTLPARPIRLLGLKETLVNDENMLVFDQIEHLLNNHPAVDVIVVLDGRDYREVLQIIQTRTGKVNQHLYTFADDPAIHAYYEAGDLSGYIEQSPQQIGEKSISVLINWLEGREELSPDPIHTSIHLVTQRVKKHDQNH
ncbi:substrate-binding domain-containing protein [Hazenella sp. IB182353]|uniref:sugar ABC transporter substrate-binding protein n=1 Tax=Polycladospora coralii TaxID=2771432 RepID=UPI0017464CFB|nr:substrate-binding domain-containing protein [Polycladospora coralii]MBS7531893.1 substrate-binding domain-containing protein [Polycladospora coralii]